MPKRSDYKQPIGELINVYQHINLQKNDYTKLAKKHGDEIKERFAEMGVDEYSSDNYTAKITTIENTDFNEEYAMEQIKQALHDKKIIQQEYNKIIKTKQYIDETALEKYIYSNPKFANEIEKAFTPKAPTIKLTIKEVK